MRHWCEPAAPGSNLCKGAEALETLYKEKPGEYLRLTASVPPREFIFENVTSDLDDEQIDELLLALRQRLIEARTAPAGSHRPTLTGLAMSLNLDIDSLPPEKVEAAITRLEAVKAQRAAENKLAHYRPYPKQAAFHEAGAKHRERLLMCANRFGKTMCGAAELAFHLTGDYPQWWNGKRFDKPVRAWAAGVTGETTRDVLQEKLIGPPFRESEWGTGMIPKAAIAGVATSRGIPAAIDTVNVRHISGGLSSLQFKSYERGREKWQGAALEVVYFDEEPDEGIYSEEVLYEKVYCARGRMENLIKRRRG